MEIEKTLMDGLLGTNGIVIRVTQSDVYRCSNGSTTEYVTTYSGTKYIFYKLVLVNNAQQKETTFSDINRTYVIYNYSNKQVTLQEFLEFHLRQVGFQAIYPEEVEAMVSTCHNVRYTNPDDTKKHEQYMKTFKRPHDSATDFALVPLFINNPSDLNIGHFVLGVVNYKENEENDFIIFDTQPGLNLPGTSDSHISHGDLQGDYYDCGFLVIQGILKLSNLTNFQEVKRHLLNKDWVINNIVNPVHNTMEEYSVQCSSRKSIIRNKPFSVGYGIIKQQNQIKHLGIKEPKIQTTKNITIPLSTNSIITETNYSSPTQLQQSQSIRSLSNIQASNVSHNEPQQATPSQVSGVTQQQSQQSQQQVSQQNPLDLL